MRQPPYFYFLPVAVVLGCAMVALETWVDPEPVSVAEFILDSLEKSLLIVGGAGVVMLAIRSRREHSEKLALISELGQARSEGAQWRERAQSHVDGLGAEMARQFAQWQLTDAEAEVALAILKGFSHKEIAVLRGTSEATVRQQARAVYQKSGLAGKAAFSAYFLEDLLAPMPAPPKPTSAASNT